ncbi:energy transducer TonB [Methylomonas sp. OY6]|uniref:Energy transducer TonB n=1 Tax=Methylomonas defluvii TaxID=3045149 RepID=A0ABU4UFD9_9GAMM|nr:energy transducer TonB [Methylomonas sp. OY6]MDX8128085.1 energy transducer TonB [Methylomonas sp. OY6]
MNFFDVQSGPGRRITVTPGIAGVELAKPCLFGTFVRFFAEARTFWVLVLISILVMSLHTCGWLCLKCLTKPIPRDKPLIMEAAIIPASVTKPRLAPLPPPSAVKKPLQKVPRQAKINAVAPLDPEPSEFAPLTQRFEAVSATPAVHDSAIASNTESVTKNAEQITEATIDTHHADNQKPNYPAIALRQGWQGQVLLRVQVNEVGVSEGVTIEHSSGYDLLDESAVEAVKQWHFNPAKRGDMAVASSVRIPIVFMIDDQASDPA